jgi:hypothetical protein
LNKRKAAIIYNIDFFGIIKVVLDFVFAISVKYQPVKSLTVSGADPKLISSDASDA